MTKYEFFRDMLDLTELYADDCEMFHITADKLMCDLLIQLGYGDGVKVFFDAHKWYS